jgi:repressor of nif and glnA expression
MQRVIFTILSLLAEKPERLTSSWITRHLHDRGIDVSERTVRHYLQMLEEKGYVEAERKRGRTITEKGKQELSHGFVSERVGFVINRINNLSFLSDFNIDTQKGKVILNVSYITEDKAAEAVRLLAKVLDSPFATSDRIIIARQGEMLGDLCVPPGHVGIGTVCSITLNGIFLKAGIPVTSRFGGIVDIVDHTPTRFASVISYESSSVAPLEIFIKSRMTDVTGVLDHGSGRILGSFREIPEASVADARRLNEKMKKQGFHGIILFGRPGETLLGIPVTADKVGMVVLGGLNPIAALEEAAIPTESRAMATLSEFGHLKPVHGFDRSHADARFPVKALIEHLRGKKQQDARQASNYWSIFSEMQQSTL